jgi:uncharacterized membrane protein
MDPAFSPLAIDPTAYVSSVLVGAHVLITGISLLAALATAFLMGQLVERTRAANPLRRTGRRGADPEQSAHQIDAKS